MEISKALKKHSKNEDMSPIICGTIVSDSIYGSDKVNFNFKRKLKMLRADVFALFSVSMS